MTEVVDPPSLAPAKGYSHGILVPSGCRLLFVAGQVGWDREGRIVGHGFVDQFERALHNVLAVVREAGGDADHVVRFTIYVTDKQLYLDALGPMGDVYRSAMGRHYPAMALVEVADLVEEGALVEIEATAAIP
ncbi:MAG: RidA family protein [Halobacteriales archaeon]|nr:RidA family protein [Halobacteriales archaeon]